jgi:hypothetical protein
VTTEAKKIAKIHHSLSSLDDEKGTQKAARTTFLLFTDNMLTFVSRAPIKLWGDHFSATQITELYE